MPRRLTLAVAACALFVGLTACAPSPAPPQTPIPTGSAIVPSATTEPSPSELPASTPPDEVSGIELPSSCDELYPADLREELEQGIGPLNDPGVTLLSTEVVEGLEILDTADTIRCSWGVPSELGLSTNVTIVDAGQAETIAQALQTAGMSCETNDGLTECEAESDSPDARYGEIHVLGANGWLATHWVGGIVDDYTEDLVDVLWEDLDD